MRELCEFVVLDPDRPERKTCRHCGHETESQFPPGQVRRHCPAGEEMPTEPRARLAWMVRQRMLVVLRIPRDQLPAEVPGRIARCLECRELNSQELCCQRVVDGVPSCKSRLVWFQNLASYDCLKFDPG